jgi:hypothetical protein
MTTEGIDPQLLANTTPELPQTLEVKAVKKNPVIIETVIKTNRKDDGIFKAFIPDYLYKPPFGYPHRVNLPYLRELAATHSVQSIVKTLCDEASSLEWDIVPKEDAEDPEKLEEKIKEIKKFFNNPNGNQESWMGLQRALIRDILEIDAGVFVKVFNKYGELKQLFCRDGMTFLVNPDIYGYYGNRADFIFPVPLPQNIQQTYDSMRTTYQATGGLDPIVQQYYKENYASMAAFFQYGFTSGSMPKPFGKREIVYVMQNNRSNSVYGRSPVETCADVIQNLLYGTLYNLDYYINGNMPEGMVSLPGAQIEEIKAFRKQFKKQFRWKDNLDNYRRVGYKYPITNIDNAQFVPFALSSKDMEILEQQKWFSKVLWMCFGVTPDEMGFTEDANRAIASEQTKVFKRKAIRPLTTKIKYAIDMQILPEFFVKEFGGDFDTAQNECPVEFKYLDYDVEEDSKKLAVAQMEIDMGIKTADMVADERGINVVELHKSKDEAMERQQEYMQSMEGQEDEYGQEEEDEEKPFNKDEVGTKGCTGVGGDKKPVKDSNTADTPEKRMKKKEKKIEAEGEDAEEKSVPQSLVEKEIDDYIKQVGRALEQEIVGEKNNG